MAHVAAFLGVSALVICTPGQDTALTINNTLRGGRRSGILTALGVVTGQATWTLAASAGVAALLVASRPAFLAVKLVGAAYLVFLGFEALRYAARGRAPAGDRAATRGPLRPRSAYLRGVVSNLGNPKIAVFFTSLLPQFASERHAFVSSLALGLLFASLTLAWLTAYAVAAAKAGDLLRSGPLRRALDAVAGAALVAAGLRLATERRP
jgi:threonine/homoserine/homoserine lactone efflux protein